MDQYQQLVLQLDKQFYQLGIMAAILFYLGYQTWKNNQLPNYIYLTSTLFFGSLLLL